MHRKLLFFYVFKINLKQKRGGPPMKKYTKQQIRDIVEQENITYLRLQFTDIMGTVKAVEIPIAKLEEAMDNKIMFDGSSIEGFVRIKEADMYLYPDLNTFLILSYEDSSCGKVARFICDVYTPDGKPFSGDPRYILKTAIANAKKDGIDEVDVGFEPEFYLFKLDSEGNPTTTFVDNASYFDNAASDGGECVRREICLQLEKMGFEVQTSHHEVGPGQNEINFKYADVLTACDNVQTFKHVVKAVAKKHGYLASFMPKPITGRAGSGMHTNVSVSDSKGNNLFYDPNDPMGLSLLCRKWITGIIHHIRELAALTNPTVNSYKRLVSGYEAPIYACWSDANRSALIRIPAVRGKGTRTELRNVDPSANPYLALAGIITVGVDGIKNVSESELVPSVSDNLFELSDAEIDERGIERLPQTLYEATQLLKKSDLLKNALGQHCYTKLIQGQEAQWKFYHTTVSQWEVDKFLKI